MRADLVLDHLVAHRERPLFAPINHRITPGTLLVIVGPNGAGKSSLLNAIIGRGVRRTGTAALGRTPLHRLRARELARTVSFVGQDSFAPNELLVRDIVDVGVRAGGAPSSGETRVFGALARLGITDLAARRYAQLSGGERQLVQVARALAQGSPLMLLDEPISALDLNHQLTVMGALAEQARAGHIVVVTMHDLTQALRWADCVGVIADGHATFGAPRDILTPMLIRRTYGVTTEIFTSPSGSPTLNSLRVSCETAADLSRTPVSNAKEANALIPHPPLRLRPIARRMRRSRTRAHRGASTPRG